jgi:hypothetical protein
MNLLARIFSSVEEWKEEALVLNAAWEAKQDVCLLCTAVKATNWRKKVALNPDGVKVEVKGELESSWDSMREVMEKLKTGSSETVVVDGGVGSRIDALQGVMEVLQDAMDKGLRSLQLGFGSRLTGLEADGDKCFALLGELQDYVSKLEEPEFVQKIINSMFASLQMGYFHRNARIRMVKIFFYMPKTT